MEKTAIAHLYRRSGAASTIARRHHDVQLECGGAARAGRTDVLRSQITRAKGQENGMRVLLRP